MLVDLVLVVVRQGQRIDSVVDTGSVESSGGFARGRAVEVGEVETAGFLCCGGGFFGGGFGGEAGFFFGEEGVFFCLFAGGFGGFGGGCFAVYMLVVVIWLRCSVDDPRFTCVFRACSPFL